MFLRLLNIKMDVCYSLRKDREYPDLVHSYVMQNDSRDSIYRFNRTGICMRLWLSAVSRSLDWLPWSLRVASKVSRPHMWVHLKAMVYRVKIRNVNHLK
jgi:hypothetical protein